MDTIIADYKKFLLKCVTLLKKTKITIQNFLYYHDEASKNYYPCKLTAEYRCDENNKTIIEYKNFGKSGRFRISIQDIFSDKKLLEKFSPLEASKITLIAFGEIFMNMPDKEREKKFAKMKTSVLKSIK